MALSVAQQPALPLRYPLQIVMRRLTCVGMQYSLLDNNYAEYAMVEVVTIAKGEAHCTCEQANGECEHIRVALEKEEAYRAETARREAHVTLFNIYA